MGTAVWTALVVMLAACNPPCEQDALGCDEGNAFQIDPDCELSGELSVALGHGQDRFALLEPAQEPDVHSGTQGGEHLWLAVRISEPAIDYPMISLVLDADVFDPERCENAPPDCDPWVGVANRTLVLGPELPITEQGDAEQASLILILAVWPLDLPRRIQLDALDACGRQGQAEHSMGPAPSL